MLQVKNLFKIFASYFDYFLSPPFCYWCKSWLNQRTVFCTGCLKLIQPVTSEEIKVKNYRVKVHAVGFYREPLKPLILAKINGNISSSAQLGYLCSQTIKELNLNIIDYIIPVPLHWLRYFKRGYNQAEIMAQEISKELNIEILNCVKRINNTKYQSLLSKEERANNVKNAFTLDSKLAKSIKAKHLLVVDDLFTTGSTVTSIIKTIIKEKPSQITVIVGARGN